MKNDRVSKGDSRPPMSEEDILKRVTNAIDKEGEELANYALKHARRELRPYRRRNSRIFQKRVLQRWGQPLI